MRHYPDGLAQQELEGDAHDHSTSSRDDNLTPATGRRIPTLRSFGTATEMPPALPNPATQEHRDPARCFYGLLHTEGEPELNNT